MTSQLTLTERTEGSQGHKGNRSVWALGSDLRTLASDIPRTGVNAHCPGFTSTKLLFLGRGAPRASRTRRNSVVVCFRNTAIEEMQQDD